MYDIFAKLLKDRGITPYRVYKETGVAQSSLSDWKNGKGTPGAEKLKKIADYLDVSLDYLLTGKQKAPTLTKKDERDIARDLENIMGDLEKGDALMFDGNPMSDEARESIMAAMKLGLEAAKLKNKERFTPKKYRKE